MKSICTYLLRESGRGRQGRFFFFLSFLFPREKRAFSGFHVWRLHIGPTEQSLDIGSQRGFPVHAKMD